MRTRLTKTAVTLAALAALAFGGASLAAAAGSSSGSSSPVTQASDVQQGDQTVPDVGFASEQSGEAPERAGETSSESAISDGLGGHADEPGNAAATYQFQGEQ